uniref:Uncharacterized protein n=1 Tax=Rhizophora mucronata TaxID=61149 RepID=A0A2P2NA22_RHIMU
MGERIYTYDGIIIFWFNLLARRNPAPFQLLMFT